MRLKEAAELHRKEQLEKLTGQGSVYILSSLITVWTPACVCCSINACHCCISHSGPRFCLHFTWQQQEFPVTTTLYGLSRSQRPSISGNFPPHPLPLTTCLPIWPYISGCGHLNGRGHLIQAPCLWAGFLGWSMNLCMWWQLKRYTLKTLKGVIQCPSWEQAVSREKHVQRRRDEEREDCLGFCPFPVLGYISPPCKGLLLLDNMRCLSIFLIMTHFCSNWLLATHRIKGSNYSWANEATLSLMIKKRTLVNLLMSYFFPDLNNSPKNSPKILLKEFWLQ